MCARCWHFAVCCALLFVDSGVSVVRCSLCGGVVGCVLAVEQVVVGCWVVVVVVR